MRRFDILFCHYGIKDCDGFGRSFSLAKGLAALGHKVSFLTSQAEKNVFPCHKENRDGVTIISFPDIVPCRLRSMGLGMLNIFLKTVYAATRSYDIVQSDAGHRPSSGLPSKINRIICGSKYVSEWWDFYGKGGIYDERPWWYRVTLGNYDRWAEVSNRMSADGVIALSEFTKNRCIALGIGEDKIAVIHGGADVHKIRYYSDTGLKTKYGIPKSSLTCCLIGMADGECIGLTPFLKAMKTLKKKIDIKWITTGDRISAWVRKRYEIGGELIEYGWLDYDSFSELLSCADLFIMLQNELRTNSWARWPNKIGDYFAAGRLIVANPVGEIVKYMKEFPESFVSVEWDAKSIETAILNLYSGKEMLADKGKVNREIAERYLSWEKRAEQLDSFYRKVVG